MTPALGRLFTWDTVTYEIVGVIEPIEHDTWGSRPVATVVTFERLRANLPSPLVAVVRTDRLLRDVVPTVETAARRTFPDPAFLSVRSADDILGQRIAGERVGATLFSWYGATAALLGLAGLYGLTSYLVAHNRREIGIRAALGAPTTSLIRMTMARALAPVVMGVAAGVALAVLASHALRAVVLGLDRVDVFAYAVAAGAFLLASLAISRVGANAVRTINPLNVLRSE